MLELYYFPTSFYSQKALLALAEKDIPVTKHRVNLGTFENYTEWFIKINPKGKVPVLIDQGKIVPDSSDIIQYLDDTYEGSRLMPELGREKWTHFQQSCEAIRLEVLMYGAAVYPELATKSHIPDSVQDKMRHVILHEKRTDQLTQMMETNPDMTDLYMQKLKECEIIESLVKDKDSVMKELDKVQSLLCEMEEILRDTKQDWLCGPDITAADICLAILLHRMNLIGFAHYLWEDNQLPSVAGYYERLLYRKSFREVCVQGINKKSTLQHVLGNTIEFLFSTGTFAIVLLAIMIGVYIYSKS